MLISNRGVFIKVLLDKHNSQIRIISINKIGSFFVLYLIFTNRRRYSSMWLY